MFMLWDIIRDFFVQYIWGGVDSNFQGFSGMIGELGRLNYEDSFSEYINSNDKLFYFLVPYSIEDGVLNYEYFTISLGDWLSTTSTIIVLIMMCIFLYVFIRWAFRLTAGLFQGR